MNELFAAHLYTENVILYMCCKCNVSIKPRD